MGRDKAMLEWAGGATLIDHMVGRLSADFRPVRIVGRNDLPDRVPGLGPLGGVATALQVAETQRTLIVAVDLPLLTPEFLKLFRSRIETSPKQVIACKIGSAYPLCLGIDKDVLELVNRRIDSGALSIHGLIEAADAEVITNLDPRIFSNVNTPEDWRRLRAGDSRSHR